MYKRILVPTDGSEESISAGKHALWLARTSGAELLVINVVEDSVLDAIRADDLREEVEKDMIGDADRLTERFEEGMIKSIDSDKVKHSHHVYEGHPANVILKTAEESGIDLIVMGKTGKHGIERFIVGSVTDRVVKSANCPVLVVP